MRDHATTRSPSGVMLRRLARAVPLRRRDPRDTGLVAPDPTIPGAASSETPPGHSASDTPVNPSDRPSESAVSNLLLAPLRVLSKNHSSRSQASDAAAPAPAPAAPTPADLHVPTSADEARAAATRTAIRIAQATEAAYSLSLTPPSARDALPPIVSASAAGVGPGGDTLPSIAASGAEPGGSEPGAHEGGSDAAGASSQGAASDLAASGGVPCARCARVAARWAD